MIEVIYYRDKHRLTVTGHAKSGEMGYDLVCAAVSALVLTLASNAENIAANKDTENHTIHIASGNAEIICNPSEKMEGVVSLMFETICTGFELLQKLYPENISYWVIG